MQEKRIKIKTQISLVQLIVATVILVSILCLLIYFVYFADFTSASTKFRGGEVIGLIIVIIPLFFSSFMNNIEYLSDIYISKKYIRLLYKKRHKITRNIVIEKKNIKAFNLDVDIEIVKVGKYVKPNVRTKFFIDLHQGKDLLINQIGEEELLESNYKFVFNILKESSSIPNFKLDVKSNSDLIKAQIDYCRKFGTEPPFLLKQKMLYDYSPVSMKVFLIIFIIILTLLFTMAGISIYAYMPPLFSPTEKKYVELVDIAYDYYKNRNYEMALSSLDKAKTYTSTDPYLYYQYAKIFKRKRNYERAYEYALEGIANLKNKHTYSKKYKLVPSSDDVNLYEILGDCAAKLNEYEIAIDAYTYVAKHTSYIYTDSYFSRGRMYYNLGMYEEAKADFYRHQEIIFKYLAYQEESKYKSKYPTYTDEDIENIEKWILACEKI